MVNVEEYIYKNIDKKTEQFLKSFARSIVDIKKKGSFSFLFATDLHYKSNDKLTFGTIKKLREMVMCAKLIKPDLFILNGDLTDGHSEKSVILAELSEMFDNLKSLDIPIIINKGNHDSATWFAFEAKSAEYVTDGEWNALVSKVTKRDECGYGYLDFDKHKIRAVYLNTSDIVNETDEQGNIASNCRQWCLGIDEEQINWLKNTLLLCPKDYTVIFFSHYIPFGEKVENGEQVWKVIKDFNQKNKVLAYIYGHKHKDFAENRNGITCICTKDMMNASVKANDNTVYCATLKDIPVICDEPVLNNPKAQILGGWDYVEIKEASFKSRRFLNEEFNREICFK
jgi:Icc-related predicted phosphoesterase